MNEPPQKPKPLHPETREAMFLIGFVVGGFVIGLVTLFVIVVFLIGYQKP